MIKLFFIVGLLAAAFILFSAVDARACLCKPESSKARIKRVKREADAIFSGSVRSVEKEMGLFGDRMVYKVIITVDRSWKDASPSEYTIYTAAGCEVYFEEHKEYLVYAKLNKSGYLETDLCMGTGLVAFKGNDLSRLGKPLRKLGPVNHNQFRNPRTVEGGEAYYRRDGLRDGLYV